MIVNIIPLMILIIYAVLTLGAANFVLRKKLGSDHFLVAARALPLALVVVVMAGDMIGGSSTVGVTQRGYSEGIVAVLVSIAAGLAFFVFAATMSGRFRRLRPVTIPEVIGKLFDTRTRLTTALVIGISYFFIAITQIMAGGALLAPLFGIKIWLAELIMTILFAVIITTGGLHSIAMVNIIQVIVILAGMLTSAVFSLVLIGGSVPAGISRIWNELPSSYWSLSLSRSPWTWSGEMLGAIFTLFAAQAAITGIFAAKDHKTAVQGAWLAGLVCMSIGLPFTVLGMCAKIHFGTSLPSGLSAAPAMMLALNPFVAGISLCGLFAAIISTGPLNFLAPIQIFIRDIYSPHINPNASDSKLVLMNRLSAIILLILGCIVATMFTELLKLTFWAFAFRGGIAVILLSLTYLGARYVSESGAFWGLISGVVVFAIWTVLKNPYDIHVAIPSMATCFVATLVLSRFIKRRHELLPEVQEALHPPKL